MANFTVSILVNIYFVPVEPVIGVAWVRVGVIATEVIAGFCIL